MKEGANWLLYPTMYAELYTDIRVGRKITRFGENHPYARHAIQLSSTIFKGIKTLIKISIMVPGLSLTAAASGLKIGAKALLTKSYVVDNNVVKGSEATSAVQTSTSNFLRQAQHAPAASAAASPPLQVADGLIHRGTGERKLSLSELPVFFIPEGPDLATPVPNASISCASISCGS
jgi:hypothetical protein